MPKQRLIQFEHGITAIDTGYVRPCLDASHLIVRDGQAAFVDTGTNESVPYLLSALEELGLSREQVAYIFLTHIHLDHAGGCGQLLKALPNAAVVVHPRGAQHMVDPSKLEKATREVYTDAVYDRLYGKLVPVPEKRIRQVQNGETLPLGKSKLLLLHTPGHALHHYCIWDDDAEAMFSGDTFGISYRVFDNEKGDAFIFPSTSPPQFDPDQAHQSIDRIVAHAPAAIFLTHFRRITEIGRLANDLHHSLEQFVAVARCHQKSEQRESKIAKDLHDWLTERLSQHGCPVDAKTRETWLQMDVRLNAAGLVAWLHRQEKTG